jgi:hypothetical protein
MIKDFLNRLMLARRSNLPLNIYAGYCPSISNDKTLTSGAGNFLIITPLVRSLAVLISIVPDRKKNKSSLTKGDQML